MLTVSVMVDTSFYNCSACCLLSVAGNICSTKILFDECISLVSVCYSNTEMKQFIVFILFKYSNQPLAKAFGTE